MPVHVYWGDDEFALHRAIATLRDRTLDPNWASFNADKLLPDQADAVVQALNQAMTPPFGSGQRFIWLVDTPITQRCSEALLAELERTLPNIPDTSVLMITLAGKPDGRLKSTKLLKQHATMREFAAISPWKTDQLIHQVETMAREMHLTLTPKAVELLADAVGNDTRQLVTELEKLSLYVSDGQGNASIDEAAIATLVTTSTQNTLQLATAIREGDTARALTLVADLLNRNEPALKIVATLVGQMRTWLWVKLMVQLGERDERAIAKAADISNPKRIYFFQKEVRSISLDQLQTALKLLLQLDLGLKQGAEPRSWIQTHVIQLCQTFQASASRQWR
ncbi:MAG TPA: DNA polymerase III subunit delta [Candidatus Obscuribacterales bacterium]